MDSGSTYSYTHIFACFDCVATMFSFFSFVKLAVFFVRFLIFLVFFFSDTVLVGSVLCAKKLKSVYLLVVRNCGGQGNWLVDWLIEWRCDKRFFESRKAAMVVYQATATAPVNIACIKYWFDFLVLTLTNTLTDTGGSAIPSWFCPQIHHCLLHLIKITCGL